MRRRAVLRTLGIAALAAATGCARPEREVPSAAPPTGPPTGSDVRPARRPAVPDPVAGRTARAVAAEVPVVCREDWGAAPATGPYTPHRIRLLTVHHTAVAQTEPDSGRQRIRQHQSFHQRSGFVDLAYHHIIDREGTVREGRPVEAAGETFTDYDPAGHYLPCLEGDFDRQVPSDAQLEALVGLLAWAAQTFSVAPQTIAGHGAYAATSCPGDALQALIDDGTLRQRVEQQLAEGAVRVVRLCAP